jgi:hypothetical protein
VQQRIESSAAGRAAISAFLVVTLVCVWVTNLPDSLLRREVSMVTQPYLEATGLDQNWRVFAPNPRQTSLRVHARVAYRDGSQAIWRPPRGGDLVGSYWDYRWAKWLENVTQDAQRERLWEPAARFVADQMRRDGHVPRRVTLVREWQDLRRPGAPQDGEHPWRSFAFYTLRVG